ncbi:MAG TPA: hypothetical protein VFB68_06460 [Xanthobacteraceae bacterium]|nr:hypothetical protein [Xanthobacteraceae bacterium]
MTDQHSDDFGVHRRETAAGVVYSIDRGPAGVFFQAVLMVFGWLFAFILGFTAWLLVWLWLGGENPTGPSSANIAYWAGLAAGIVVGLPILFLFRILWRRFGGKFTLSKAGIVKDERTIPWAEAGNLRLVDSTSGVQHVPGTAMGAAMGVASRHGMALAVDSRGKRVLLAVGLDPSRGERLMTQVAADIARLKGRTR